MDDRKHTVHSTPEPSYWTNCAQMLSSYNSAPSTSLQLPHHRPLAPLLLDQLYALLEQVRWITGPSSSEWKFGGHTRKICFRRAIKTPAGREWSDGYEFAGGVSPIPWLYPKPIFLRWRVPVSHLQEKAQTRLSSWLSYQLVIFDMFLVANTALDLVRWGVESWMA